MSDYMLDQGDVRVTDYIPMCTECDDKLATKVVMVDFRSAGQENAIGHEMCGDCAEIISERIKEGLPTADYISQSDAKADKHYNAGWDDAVKSAAKIARAWADSPSCAEPHTDDPCCHVRTGAGIASKILETLEVKA